MKAHSMQLIRKELVARRGSFTGVVSDKIRARVIERALTLCVKKPGIE